MSPKFDSLSTGKKIILVAKDVLKQLKMGKYKAHTGAYIVNKVNKGDIKKGFKNMKPCEVCAMGACILSITHYKNKLDWKDVGGGLDTINTNLVTPLLQNVFTPKQILMIETAFEGEAVGGAERYGTDILEERLTIDESNKCISFSDKYILSKNRLIAIMNNIIKNKGEFIP